MGAWLLWLERSPLGVAIRELPWVYPAVEIGHIFGFAVLVGSAAMFDLRLLGLSRSMSVRALAHHLLPWARVGLGLAAPTGLLLFVADATSLVFNPAFQIKLGLILLAILNASAFHRWTFHSVDEWDRERPTPLPGKLAAVASLTLWLLVIASGRLIAYV